MDARDAILTLLAARRATRTICPSEAARAIAKAHGAAEWRQAMPAVHAAVERLAAEGVVRVTWRGSARVVGDGPYRIGRGDAPTVSR